MKVKTLFDTLYEKTEESLKLFKKPLVKKKIKRRLCAAYDDAENKKVDAESEIQDLRGNFEDYDVNRILEQKKIIDTSNSLQKGIEEEYKELFNESIPKDD